MQNSNMAVMGGKFFESQNIQKLVDDKSLQFQNPLQGPVIILQPKPDPKIINIWILVTGI